MGHRATKDRSPCSADVDSRRARNPIRRAWGWLRHKKRHNGSKEGVEQQPDARLPVQQRHTAAANAPPVAKKEASKPSPVPVPPSVKQPKTKKEPKPKPKSPQASDKLESFTHRGTSELTTTTEKKEGQQVVTQRTARSARKQGNNKLSAQPKSVKRKMRFLTKDDATLTTAHKIMAKEDPAKFCEERGSPLLMQQLDEANNDEEEAKVERKFEKNLKEWGRKHNLPQWAQTQLRAQLHRELHRRRHQRERTERSTRGGAGAMLLPSSVRESNTPRRTLVSTGAEEIGEEPEERSSPAGSPVAAPTVASKPKRPPRPSTPIRRKTPKVEERAGDAKARDLQDLLTMVCDNVDTLNDKSEKSGMTSQDSQMSLGSVYTPPPPDWDAFAPLSAIVARQPMFDKQQITDNTLESTALTLHSPKDKTPVELCVEENGQPREEREISFSNFKTVHKYTVRKE